MLDDFEDRAVGENEHFDEEGIECRPTIRRGIAGMNSRESREKGPRSVEVWGSEGKIDSAFASQSFVVVEWLHRGSQMTGASDVWLLSMPACAWGRWGKCQVET